MATIPGQHQHVLELTRIYATDEALADGIDFYSLEDFSLVICKPDRRVIYSGCQWSKIGESGTWDRGGGEGHRGGRPGLHPGGRPGHLPGGDL